LAIGDRNLDVRAAHAAGLPAALFAPTPTNVRAEFVLADFGVLRRMIAFQRTPHAGPSTALAEHREV
jgi:phosphoglycolate phosphatase-like HAD superfamily hydrolase